MTGARDKTESRTVMGKITSVYGVKGWVKVFSYTQPKENICRYKTWTIQRGKEQRVIEVLECKPHGNGLVARLKGCNDREQARTYSDFLIKIEKEKLPELAEGDYYWHQLEGLDVSVPDVGLLGKVSHLMETGSNDVLVIKPCDGSMDDRERLVPYLVDQVVKSVSLDEKQIIVDWDPEF